MSSTGRRRGPLRKMSANVGPNMTPMVDVVLCILIFFMLGAEFVKPELFLSSNMAAVDQGPAADVGVHKLPSVVMSIQLRRQNGHTEVSAFNSAYMPLESVSGNGESISGASAKLPENAGILALLASKRKNLSDDVQVILLPDKQVPYQDVITLYDYCTKLQFKQVAFAAAR